MAKAISSFGLYLGSIEPRVHGDCHSWSVFLATDNLASIPFELELKVGGLVYSAVIRPRRWIKGQVYQPSDLPPAPSPYSPPDSPTDGSSPYSIWFQDDDIMSMSLQAIREVLRDVPFSKIPPDLAACLAGDKEAIRANHAAYRRWERENGQEVTSPTRTETLFAAANPAPSRAAADPAPPRVAENPPLLTLIPTASPVPLHEPTRPPNQPTPRATVQTSPAPNSAASTVHRTETHAAPKAPAPIDLALQVCPNTSLLFSDQTDRNWMDHDLFPETCMPPPKTVPRAFNKGTAKDKNASPGTEGSDPNPPHRTARNKTGSNKDIPLLSLKVHDFIDVPLQYAEGRDLLSLIGAASIPFPPHLLNPVQIQASPLETGQPSKAKHKRKKPVSPPAQNPLALLPASVGTQGPSPQAQHQPSFSLQTHNHPSLPTRVGLTVTQPMLTNTPDFPNPNHLGKGNGEPDPSL